MKRNDIVQLMLRAFLQAPDEAAGLDTMDRILTELESSGILDTYKLARYESVLKRIVDVDYSDALHIEQMAKEALNPNVSTIINTMWKPS